MPRARTATSSRPAWVHEMAAAYDAARYGEAAAVFDRRGKDAPINAVLMRARIFLKKDEPAGAIGLLSSRRPVDDAERGETLMLLASAHARMRRFREADQEFEAAATRAQDAKAADLCAEIAYRRAIRFVQEQRGADARKQIALARKGRSRRAQIRATEAESFLLASEARYEDQARLLINLLESLDPNSNEFLESRAWAAHTLAVLARELYLPQAVPLVERHLEAGDWTDELAVNRFQGVKAVGWAHALRGDYFSAFRYLKRSLTIAPGKEWRAMARADRAYLAHCNRELLWFRQELVEAEELAAQVDWSAMRGEEPIALLLIAELFVSLDPSRAAYYVARFEELSEVRNRLLHFRNDARLQALTNYSRATVELALGNKRTGLELLTSTERFYSDVQYNWRAGRCALDIYQATGNAVYLKRAKERLSQYMGSWLGERVRQASTAGASGIALPPMQRKVFDGICRGMSNAEIAREIERSEFTVANHVKVLLKVFQVPSRSALLAEAVRRKLVAD